MEVNPSIITASVAHRLHLLSTPLLLTRLVSSVRYPPLLLVYYSGQFTGFTMFRNNYDNDAVTLYGPP